MLSWQVPTVVELCAVKFQAGASAVDNHYNWLHLKHNNRITVEASAVQAAVNDMADAAPMPSPLLKRPHSQLSQVQQEIGNYFERKEGLTKPAVPPSGAPPAGDRERKKKHKSGRPRCEGSTTIFGTCENCGTNFTSINGARFHKGISTFYKRYS